MKRIQLLLACLVFVTTAFAQATKEQWKGFIGKEKCTLSYTIKTEAGAQGFEESITYKGTLSIGTKKIPVTGWFEGNTIRFEQMIKGKKVQTLYFDLSSEEGK